MGDNSLFKSSLEGKLLQDGSPLDDIPGDRILWYKGMCFLALPIHGPFEVEKRSHEYLYQSVKDRIDRDRLVWESELSALAPIMTGRSLSAVTDRKINDLDPYWENGYFSGDDARVAYAIAAHHKPSVILEVGAGNSTKFFRKAITDFELPTRLKAIDPQPRADINAVCDEVIVASALSTPLEVFKKLNSGDILFWDGSHICYNGSDVTRLFLEVLPILKPGVMVHVHDIMLPYEANFHWQVGSVSYGEQYVLGSALLASNAFRVLCPVHYLSRMGKLKHGGVSFWFVV